MNNSILKLFIVVFTITISLSCKNKTAQNIQETGYTISGTIKGLNEGSVKITDSGNRDKVTVIDSTQIVNGTFKFSGKVDFPDMVNLIIDGKTSRFFIENSPITIAIDWTSVQPNNWQFESEVSGSKSHDEYTKIEAQTMAIFSDPKYEPLEEVRKLYSIAKQTKKTEDLEKAQNLQKELMPLSLERQNRYVNTKIDYVKNNPDSPIAVHILGYQYAEGRMNKEELKEFYHLFKGEARKTGFFKHYMTKVYKDNFENLGVGNTAPDFTLKTVNGKDLTLSKVEAKYKLVDFWASWCVPCRASFPHLKELRKKYNQDGFKIVGIGTADLEDKWRKAIEEDQTPWIHVFDTGEGRAYGPVAKKYGVPHLPTTFLVDNNNTILLRNPTKEELDSKLKELFGH
ncbi:AhpC/TSA family protein [Seonamhaeicola sp. NFXS20]|uniref:DUF4369 domain-containing protein n=1 Tax=unclassified Seonamhaeicola TaxID=2622645 RepID=UPI003569FDA4